MKNTLRNTLFSIVLIGAPLAAFSVQDNSEKAYDLPTYTVEDIATLPEPTQYQIPAVKSQFVGMIVKVKFTVSLDGKPENVRLEKPLVSYSDLEKMSFASRLENAVKNWRFEPAIDTAGNPVAVKVILPVEVKKKGSRLSTIAALVLDTEFQETSEVVVYSATNI